MDNKTIPVSIAIERMEDINDSPQLGPDIEECLVGLTTGLEAISSLITYVSIEQRALTESNVEDSLLCYSVEALTNSLDLVGYQDREHLLAFTNSGKTNAEKLAMSMESKDTLLGDILDAVLKVFEKIVDKIRVWVAKIVIALSRTKDKLIKLDDTIRRLNPNISTKKLKFSKSILKQTRNNFGVFLVINDGVLTNDSLEALDSYITTLKNGAGITKMRGLSAEVTKNISHSKNATPTGFFAPAIISGDSLFKDWYASGETIVVRGDGMLFSCLHKDLSIPTITQTKYIQYNLSSKANKRITVDVLTAANLRVILNMATTAINEMDSLKELGNTAIKETRVRLKNTKKASAGKGADFERYIVIDKEVASVLPKVVSGSLLSYLNAINNVAWLIDETVKLYKLEEELDIK